MQRDGTPFDKPNVAVKARRTVSHDHLPLSKRALSQHTLIDCQHSAFPRNFVCIYKCIRPEVLRILKVMPQWLSDCLDEQMMQQHRASKQVSGALPLQRDGAGARIFLSSPLLVAGCQ